MTQLEVHLMKVNKFMKVQPLLQEIIFKFV